MRRLLLALVALSVTTNAAFAQSKLLVRQPSSYFDYGYGRADWDSFTGIFNANFGAANIVQTNSLGVGSLTGYSALMLSLPTLPDGPYLLTADERTEITSFLNGGGRLYAVGENDNWAAWSPNIASLFGATVGSGFFPGPAVPVSTSGLTTGVTEVDYSAGGAFDVLGGGTSLFDTNVAALFGPTSNALVMLDANLCDDFEIGQANNQRFCSNIGGWLAGTIDPPVTAVPEPASVLLLGAGLAGVWVARRRRV